MDKDERLEDYEQRALLGGGEERIARPSKREIEIDIDYLGFEIPDAFVVGYGFDYKEKYRTLRDIVVMKPE